MKIPVFIGGLVALPLGIVLMGGYAGTPQDPQKAVGYVMILLYLCLVWGSVALFAAALKQMLFDKQQGGSVLMAPALVGIAFSGALLVHFQMRQTRANRLVEGVETDFLRNEAQAGLKQKKTNDLRAIASNPNTPGDVLAGLADYHDLAVLSGIGRNPGAPRHLLQNLSASPHYRVREAVLQNPKVTRELVLKMLADPDPRIRTAARDKISSL